jgi:oxygen-independent coproporphyrinogen-3 oxidase
MIKETMQNREQVTELLPLLKKYSKPGPRYTSYPTAPCFSSDYSQEMHRSNIIRSDGELSLYVHLPFCDTLCYFCGCTMLVSNNRERIAQYLDYLIREIELTSKLAFDRKVGQIHWGGGTPTHLLPEEIRRLGEAIRKHFHILPDAEISVEIDPREVTPEHIQALADVGFRRASIGVQDVNDDVQRAINRVQPIHVTRQVIEWCRAAGFESINIDLIYGLPLQTRASFNVTVERVLDFDPDRIALYNFAYVPWMKPHQKLINIEDLPETDEKLKLFTYATDKFLEAGYSYIGMDHFAKPNDELSIAKKEGSLQRNFQGYSTRAGRDLLGLGMSAISHIGSHFSQNVKTLDEYYAKLNQGLLPIAAGLEMSYDDRVRKYAIMQLMCSLQLDKEVLRDKFKVEFDSCFADALSALQEFEAEGLVILTPNSIIVTERGRFFIRNIVMCFDAYLGKQSERKVAFSKTI